VNGLSVGRDGAPRARAPAYHDRRQAVRNGEDRAVGKLLAHRLLDQRIGLHVHAAGRLGGGTTQARATALCR